MSIHILAFGWCPPIDVKLKNHDVQLTLLIQKDRIKLEHKTYHDWIIGIPKEASIEEWVTMARNVHSMHPVTHIFAYHELFQEKAAFCAEALGLPFLSVDTIHFSRYKDQMREQLHRKGLDTTPYQIVTSAEEVARFAQEYHYPVILKPVDGWASVGVSKVEKQEEIVPAITWLHQGSSHSAMLVEQCLEGEEYSVEVLSENGRHHILCITQKYKEEKHCVETGHCVPALLDKEKEDSICNFTRLILSALNITHGPSHTEIMFTKEGPRIIETHVRIAGDHIIELYEIVSKIDLMEIYAKQVMGESVLSLLPQKLPENTFASIWFAMVSEEGVISDIFGADEAQSMPGIIRVEVAHKPGALLQAATDSFSRSGFAISTGSSPKEAITAAKNAIQQVTFSIRSKE